MLEVIKMRGFSGLLIFLIVLVVLQAAWPLIVFFGVYMLGRYLFTMLTAKKAAEDYQRTEQQKQVNEDWINRSYQQSTNNDVIDVEYTEREADK